MLSNVRRSPPMFVHEGVHTPSKCWSFVTEDGGSINTLRYKLGVSDYKCEDGDHTFKLNILNPMGSKVATRVEYIEREFSCLDPSFTI